MDGVVYITIDGRCMHSSTIRELFQQYIQWATEDSKAVLRCDGVKNAYKEVWVCCGTKTDITQNEVGNKLKVSGTGNKHKYGTDVSPWVW